jgi:4-amino-4-deoxy-L-arabinose transferase-like glycosyltransferase
MEQSQTVPLQCGSKLSSSIWLVAILGLTWLLRMKFWGQPLIMDEGLHAYMGWGMLQGLVPFKDMYNTKPPGIYVLHSLLFLLVEPTALNIKVFATIYTLGTVLAVFFVARKLAGERAGLFAALLFGIFSSGANIDGYGVNSEVFMVLPYTLAAYSLLQAVETGRSKPYFLFGFWTGLACTIKQVAAVNLFWVAVYLLVRLFRANERNRAARRSLKHGLWVAAGAVLPWLPFCIYFYLHDALGKFYYWMVTANARYITGGYSYGPNLNMFFDGMSKILSENGLLWLLALAGIGGLWNGLRWSKLTFAEQGRRSWQQTAWILMALWPVFSFLGIALGGRFYSHYFIQIIPPLAVLGGTGLAGLIADFRTTGSSIMRGPAEFIVAGVFAWCLVLFVGTEAPYYLKLSDEQISHYRFGTAELSVARYIGRYLRNRTETDDFIYVWRWNPEINFYALRKSPSPILVHTYSDNIPWNILSFPWGDPEEEAIQSLYRFPPKYIVVLQKVSDNPLLQDYLKLYYQEETSLELEKLKKLRPFKIYRHRNR